MKLAFVTLLLVSLVLSSCFLESTTAQGPPQPIAPTPAKQSTGLAPPQPIAPTPATPSTAPATPSYCNSKCGARCSKAGFQMRCIRFCKICCQKCSCVPSGTYGNKSECPCYANLLNSKGKSKCP